MTPHRFLVTTILACLIPPAPGEEFVDLSFRGNRLPLDSTTGPDTSPQPTTRPVRLSREMKRA